MSKVTQPRTPRSLLAILVRVHDAKPGRQGVTAKQVQTDAIRMGRLAERGLVKVVATERHTDEEGNVKRGRPMNRYGLTDKGRKRAQNAAKRTTQEA